VKRKTLHSAANEFIQRLGEIVQESPDLVPLLRHQVDKQPFEIGALRAAADIGSIVAERATAWTVPELAELLQMSPRSLYDLIKQDRLQAIRIGTALRLCPAATQKWFHGLLTSSDADP
jgi:excisionase family DNA binding protein